MKAIAGVMVVVAVCAGLCSSALALNPKNESQFRAALANFVKNSNAFGAKMSFAFRPGAAKDEGGMEEIAWRAKDLQERTEKINRLAQDYWKNETDLLGALDQWHQDAKALDETMVYTPVSADISDLWKITKEYAMEVRDYVEEIPSEEEAQKAWEGFKFEIVKVGRYGKKQVLREKVKEFIGGSQLDKFPFPDERRELYPEDVGELYVIRFKVSGKPGAKLNFPLKVRFEYKFSKHTNDGSYQQVFTNIGGGKHNVDFRNVGEEFIARGQVLHWRASVLLNEKVVAKKQSAMWRVVSEWAQK